MLRTKTCYIKRLEENQFHKLIIGAALKDYQTIEDYAYYFTHAGADVIDISAFPHSVISARKAIEEAIKENPNLAEPLIMVSVNIGKDPHFRRIELNEENCTECLACVPTCPSDAFVILSEASGSQDRTDEILTSPPAPQDDKFFYKPDLCFGCGLCLPSCQFEALKFKNWSAFEPNSLQELQELGASAIEIHLNNDLEAFKTFYFNMETEFELESFCIGSAQMNELELREATLTIIDTVETKHGSQKPFIIQVDGRPMSGASKNSTDQNCIDAAKSIIDLQSEQVFIQLAGGVTENTFQKAFEQGLKVNGVAIGSYARKQISNRNSKDDRIKEAINIVQNSSNQREHLGQMIKL